MNDAELVKNDFRLFLQQEFVSRCRKNSRYSLRAFAKSLSIGPSPLSAILRGKRPITLKMKKRLGLALGLNLDALSRPSGDTTGADFQQLALDSYAVISDWYHYAILELIRLKTFKPSLKYISKALNISRTEAHIAVERLKRVGLLKIHIDGHWIDTSEKGLATNIHSDLTSEASRKLQKQILEMALQALEVLPTSVRNHTSMTMAVNPSDLPEAKERIKKFRRELCQFFERNERPTQVYNLGICLYPITKMGE